MVVDESAQKYFTWFRRDVDDRARARGIEVWCACLDQVQLFEVRRAAGATYAFQACIRSRLDVILPRKGMASA